MSIGASLGTLRDLLAHLKPKHWTGQNVKTGNPVGAVSKFGSGLSGSDYWLEFTFAETPPTPDHVAVPSHVLRAKRGVGDRTGGAEVTLDGKIMSAGMLSVHVHTQWFSLLADVEIRAGDGTDYSFTAKLFG